MLNLDGANVYLHRLKGNGGSHKIFYMWVINSHKVNEEWLRAVRQIVDEGDLQRRSGPTVDMHCISERVNLYTLVNILYMN